MNKWLERYRPLFDGENDKGSDKGGTDDKSGTDEGVKVEWDKDTIQQRFDELTRHRRTAERDRDTLKAEKDDLATKLAAAEAMLKEAGKKVQVRDKTLEEVLADPEIEKEIERRAGSKATTASTAAQIQATADKLYDDGAEVYGGDKFDEALGTFKQFDGLKLELVEALSAVDNGHLVLYHLGTNPKEIQRLYRINSPARLAAEVVKLAGTIKPPKKTTVSKAPEPPEHEAGRGSKGPIDLADKEVPMADWVKAREKDLAERKVRI